MSRLSDFRTFIGPENLIELTKYTKIILDSTQLTEHGMTCDGRGPYRRLHSAHYGAHGTRCAPTIVHDQILDKG